MLGIFVALVPFSTHTLLYVSPSFYEIHYFLKHISVFRKRGLSSRTNILLLFAMLIPFILSSAYWILEVVQEMVRLQIFFVHRSLHIPPSGTIVHYEAVFDNIIYVNVRCLTLSCNAYLIMGCGQSFFLPTLSLYGEPGPFARQTIKRCLSSPPLHFCWWVVRDYLINLYRAKPENPISVFYRNTSLQNRFDPTRKCDFDSRNQSYSICVSDMFSCDEHICYLDYIAQGLVSFGLQLHSTFISLWRRK